MTIRHTTIIISISVKPRQEPVLGIRFIPESLPILIFRAVERSAFRLAVNVKNVLPIPGGRRGIVLYGAHPPFALASHGIDRNLAQESELLAIRIDPLYECIQIR